MARSPLAEDFRPSDSRPEDPHRPAFHFLPERGWMNDPNGMIDWKNRRHLFYQYNGKEVGFGTMQWGHAVSTDWIHWEHLPLAIDATPGGPDKDGAWSGCCVAPCDEDDQTVTAVYTGVNPQTQCIATSRDPMLRTWEKFAGNPVIATPPAGILPGRFRDPFVWRETDDSWRAVVGAGTDALKPCVLHYRSRDLRAWEYLGPLLSGDSDTGRMWECPFFIPMGGGKHVLVVSVIPLDRVIYFTGDFDGTRFTPTHRGTLDHGVGEFYAPHATRDSRGRWVMMSWMRESRPKAAFAAAGWAGVMTCPRELFLNSDGSVGQRPLDELATLRSEHWSIRDHDTSIDASRVPVDFSGDQLDIKLQARPLQGGAVSLIIRKSPDGSEQTTIICDPFSQTLTLDRSRSTLDPAPDRRPQTCPLRVRAGEVISLRVVVDHSLIEIFLPDGSTLSSRIYPTRTDSTGIEVTGKGPLRVELLDTWSMRGIW